MSILESTKSAAETPLRVPLMVALSRARHEWIGTHAIHGRSIDEALTDAALSVIARAAGAPSIASSREAGRSALATDDDRIEAHAVIAQAVLGVGLAGARFVADGIFDFERAVECVADVLARKRAALPVTAGDLHARDAQLLGGDAMREPGQ